MNDSPMTAERWIGNLIDAVQDIANKDRQERRWHAPDAMAWERPEELISTLFDDYNFELFIKQYNGSFSDEQRAAANSLCDKMVRFNDETPGWLDAAAVLTDPRWSEIRGSAVQFVDAFNNKWPKDLHIDRWRPLAA
jgi:hypothetical protein